MRRKEDSCDDGTANVESFIQIPRTIRWTARLSGKIFTRVWPQKLQLVIYMCVEILRDLVLWLWLTGSLPGLGKKISYGIITLYIIYIC